MYIFERSTLVSLGSYHTALEVLHKLVRRMKLVGSSHKGRTLTHVMFFFWWSQNHSAQYNDPMSFWEEPAVVPECLLTHLEIFEWRQYENTVQHRKVAACILANATCLKMATFSTRSRNKDHRMVMKLKKLKRISKTCQLVFE